MTITATRRPTPITASWSTGTARLSMTSASPVTAYALNTNAWLLRHPARKEIQDLNGKVISRMEYYYDDESFSGNNFGQVTIGNLTLTRAWIDPGQRGGLCQGLPRPVRCLWQCGDVAGPIGSGVRRGGGLHPRPCAADRLRRSVPQLPGSGNHPRRQRERGPSCSGLVTTRASAPTTSTVDFNQNQTSYAYDAFARLINIVKPYDTAGLSDLAVRLLPGRAVRSQRPGQLRRDPPTGQIPGPAGANQRDYYLISRPFSDGLGRTVMTNRRPNRRRAAQRRGWSSVARSCSTRGKSPSARSIPVLRSQPGASSG